MFKNCYVTSADIGDWMNTAVIVLYRALGFLNDSPSDCWMIVGLTHDDFIP